MLAGGILASYDSGRWLGLIRFGFHSAAEGGNGELTTSWGMARAERFWG
jgi:hypothetical protein